MQPMEWNSSLLEAAAYQDRLALLKLTFRSGSIYHYFGVSAPDLPGTAASRTQGPVFQLAHPESLRLHPYPNCKTGGS